MDINVKLDNKSAVISLCGRLDTNTAPSLEEKLSSLYGNVTNLEFDFEKLEYVSSAGLRVLLTAQKNMNTCGTMVIKNVADAIMEVFEITGFTDVLNIE